MFSEQQTKDMIKRTTISLNFFDAAGRLQMRTLNQTLTLTTVLLDFEEKRVCEASEATRP